MAAQLTCDPIIKITLTSNENFDEVAPGYSCDGFKLTKGLLKPNKFEFILCKENLTLETADVTFELRNKLLAAMVEVKLQARREEGNEIVEYEVEDFFYGFIQNIQVYRAHGGAVKFKCTAFSPDAKMKHFPATRTFVDCNLGTILAVVTSFNVIEPMIHFDKKEGKYERNSADDCLNVDLNFAHDSSNCKEIPYTVQYNESPYNFLKRMARRHGEFMYYENRTFHFGAMRELPEVHLNTALDLEDYTYEMNMNDHTGILFTKFDTFRGAMRSVGFQKREQNNTERAIYKSVVEDDGYQNDMAKSAYETSPDFFSDRFNSAYEMGAQPLFDINIDKVDDSNQNRMWYNYQREFLDRYVMSDSLICKGKADRVDLKLGSIIVIEDETKTGEEKEEKVEHKPLKVVELTYYWDRSKQNLEVKNWFKAIPQDAKVPPYLERDKDGFLVYGDFDLYPQCGPHYGMVIDNRDPEHLGRVKVALIWQMAMAFCIDSDNWKRDRMLSEEDNRTPWIWMLSPYQGHNHGVLAVPEVGDLVLVGFEHNNAERPYVMGARYCDVAPMPSEWQQFNKNNVKGFRSRGGHTIEFIDKDGDYKDGAADYATGGKIHIYDAMTHAYDIVFDTDKKLIRLKSKGNIELSADGNIALKAGNNIVMNASNDINVEAGNDIDSHAKNDIYRTADNDVWDVEGHDYANEVTNDLNMYMKDGDGTHIHMIDERIQLQVNQDEVILRMDKSEGATIQAEKNTFLTGKDKLGIYGKNSVIVKSDTKAEIGAPTVDVKGDTSVMVNGGVVKIN